MFPQKTFFTAGPAQLYPNFEQIVQKAIQNHIGSISHRSKQFRNLYQETFENLSTLLNLPKDIGVFFLGSATEIWERTLQNLVEKYSFHFVNGSFSKKYYDFSVQLGKNAQKYEVALGKGFSQVEVSIPAETELLCLTQNETSTGAMMSVEKIHAFKKAYPQTLVSVDMVSSAPYPALDFSLIDTAFFSVQKAFGLPAGLGVWIANEACLEKAQKLQKKQISIGTYHSLPTLWQNFKNFETPETPNVWAIFLLNEVLKDMLQKGIQNIRYETEQKAKKLYQLLEESPHFQPFVKESADRSATVIVAETKLKSDVIIQQLAQKNAIVGAGYGNLKDYQIRIANFPAIRFEEVEKLINLLANIEIER
ncbi:MAG: aminotransferase class V-fold PLP-dependent enzyme [Microscillaceae bacterium]|nr:aminotransferase class V-fold PLP-dependent enzyme [Microscillaceae bacterium]MDW8461677.1 aminotransferase class V-fold PLP-dependent enzyme [Cytophagales bacterium]